MMEQRGGEDVSVQHSLNETTSTVRRGSKSELVEAGWGSTYTPAARAKAAEKAEETTTKAAAIRAGATDLE